VGTEEETVPRDTGYVGAVLGGLAGAAVGAGAWAVFILVFHIYWGAVAFLVGLAAGLGAYHLGGRRGGQAVQVIACVCALLGFLAGTYLVNAHPHANWVEAHEKVRPGLLDPRVWRYVWGNPDHHFGFLDLVWCAFALWGAWIIPKRPSI